MDWERTKTILIAAFLLLNAIFLVQLWVIPTYFDASLFTSRSEVEARLRELRYRNIEVEADVPRHLQRVKMLEFSLPDVDHKHIAESILGPEAVHVATYINPRPGYKVFRERGSEVNVYNDGRVTYKTVIPPDPSSVPESNAVSAADSFIRSTLGMPKDARLAVTEKNDDGTWWIEYRQRWRRRDLQTSYIRCHVVGETVTELEHYWLKPLGFIGRGTLTIPATGALMVVADHLNSGTTITDIYLSWYSPPLVAESWRAPPVWVVKTDNSGRYYINAFTGELEAQQEFPPER